MYEIFFTKTAEQQLKKLPKNIKNEIGSALERIKIRPFSYIKKLRNSRYYKLRVGRYRIILDANPIKLIILVIEIGHRSEIYK